MLPRPPFPARFPERGPDPTDKNRISVVAAIIERDGRFLLGRRNPLKRHGGLWEFPGGKLEDGETHFEAARRELSEELGVALSDFQGIVFSLHDPDSDFVIDFVRASVSGEPTALEHTEIRWVSVDEIAFLELAPSDRVIARNIVDRHL